jgi:branched-chain amino acid transport system permease protein
LLGGIAVGALFGWLTEVLAIRRVLNRGEDHLWLLSTLALATMVQQGVALWWGTEPRPFPRLFEQNFNSGVLDQKFWLPIGITVLMALGLELFYRRTMYGKLFMAMSEDAFAARARGVPTDRIRVMSYVLAGGLGGLAGFAAGQLTFAYFALGLTLTLNGFIALAVGGLGSNLGALIGGTALGLLSAFASYWFGGEYQQTFAVGLLMVVLLVKPAGLYGSLKVRQV